MKIAVAGTGYVGLSLAVLLARKHEVCAVDIAKERVEKLKRRESPIADADIERYLKEEALRLEATLDPRKGYAGAEFAVVAVPTNYDPERNFFDTSAVEAVARQIREINPDACIVIKSTVPVGFTAKLRAKLDHRRILFSPEFLREGRALRDNLYPSRIIVGVDEGDGEMCERAMRFAALLRECALKEGVPAMLMGSSEAESVKLFSNACLAMRVGFFNELDSYAEATGLNVREIIEGVCLEPRIGRQYNNPSFGYGGYCFPKDTKQLRANFAGVPQRLINAIVETNDVRKKFIVEQILNRLGGAEKPVVGVYRLTMKANSDNFRQSAIRDIMAGLRKRSIGIVIYEPMLRGADSFEGYAVESEFARFAQRSDVIIANRYENRLDPVRAKVYTRDLYQCD